MKSSLVVAAVIAVVPMVAAEYGYVVTRVQFPITPGNCDDGPFGLVAADYLYTLAPIPDPIGMNQYENYNYDGVSYAGCAVKTNSKVVSTEAEIFAPLAGSQIVTVKHGQSIIGFAMNKCLPASYLNYGDFLPPVMFAFTPFTQLFNVATDAGRFSCPTSTSCKIEFFSDRQCNNPKQVHGKTEYLFSEDLSKPTEFTVIVNGFPATLVVQVRDRSSLLSSGWKITYIQKAFYTDMACATKPVAYALEQQTTRFEPVVKCSLKQVTECAPDGDYFSKTSCVEAPTLESRADFDDIASVLLPAGNEFLETVVCLDQVGALLCSGSTDALANVRVYVARSHVAQSLDAAQYFDVTLRQDSTCPNCRAHCSFRHAIPSRRKHDRGIRHSRHIEQDVFVVQYWPVCHRRAWCHQNIRHA
jgi:hypothetical protein